MNVPESVQECFYVNVLGEEIFDEEEGLRKREWYEEFKEGALHEDETGRDLFWYDMVIREAEHVVEKGYGVRKEDIEYAKEVFDQKDEEEKKEIVEKYEEWEELYKVIEVYAEWFHEMYENVVDVMKKEESI